MIHLANSTVYELSKNPNKWEAFIVQGLKLGQVSWLRRTNEDNGVLATGLWKHHEEEHPDGMPYGVEGSETFHVIKGEAEIETEKGEKIVLKEGNSYSFTDGFLGTWKTKGEFIKFFIVC